jgi:hypothetical protein
MCLLVVGKIGVLEMLLWPKNNGGISDGMAWNGVMAHGMAEWSNGRINGNGQIVGMMEWERR